MMNFFNENPLQMGFALFFNILAVIVSLGASAALILFTVLLNEVRENKMVCTNVGSTCTCKYRSGPDEIDSESCMF